MNELQEKRERVLFEKKEIELKLKGLKKNIKHLEFKYKTNVKDVNMYQHLLQEYLTYDIKLSEINYELSIIKTQLENKLKESEFSLLKNIIVEKYGVEELSNLMTQVYDIFKSK